MDSRATGYISCNKRKKGLAFNNARHALNFQISMTIYYIISVVLIIVLIGLLLLWGLGIFGLIVVIIASIKAYGGEVYKYPLEIEFIK
jgi:uncharacterized protein